jgi:hypothetical protein
LITDKLLLTTIWRVELGGGLGVDLRDMMGVVKEMEGEAGEDILEVVGEEEEVDREGVVLTELVKEFKIWG